MNKLEKLGAKVARAAKRLHAATQDYWYRFSHYPDERRTMLRRRPRETVHRD